MRILLFILLLSNYATAAPTLTATITPKLFIFNMSQLTNSVSVGSKNFQVPFSQPGRVVTYQGSGSRPSGAVYGPIWYKTSFYAPNVDMNNTTTYNSIKYYKLKNTDYGNIYVALQQLIYNNDNGKNKYYMAPFTANNDVRITSFAGFPSSNVEGLDAKFTSSSVTINLQTGTSGDNGTIYFYFPSKPTRTVVFNNYHLADINMSDTIAPGYKSSYPGDSTMTLFNEIILTGSLTFNNACRVYNNGATVAIPLGALDASRFTTKGGLPRNYTGVTTNIEFSCDNDIPSTYGSNSIKWSINAATESTSSEANNGILKAVAAGNGNTINNLGVQLKSPQNNNNAINATGAVNYPTTISGKKSTAQITAYPTMINSNKPSGAGDFRATATVTFNIP